MSTTTSQQFDGPTIEEALAAAVDAFGDDLEIIDAQRVRRRKLLGVRRQDRFEVTAARRGQAEPKGFEDVLARMVDRVDVAERSLGADLADTSSAWWNDAEFVIPSVDTATEQSPAAITPDSRSLLESLDQVDIDVRDDQPFMDRSLIEQALTATADTDLAAEPEIHLGAAATSPAASPHVGDAPLALPVEPSPKPTAEDVSGPAWSAEALLELGLPRALVGRIRADELHADLEWVGALATAIDELLETAQTMTGPCELTGHGAASAVQLIRGACDGFRIGSIVIDDRQMPATALELALAIRSLLRSDRALQGATS